MSKTTKTVKPILSLQKFNQGDIVRSVTIDGRTGLADVSLDKQGNLTLTMKADTTKVNVSDYDTKVAELEARLTALENKGV